MSLVLLVRCSRDAASYSTTRRSRHVDIDISARRRTRAVAAKGGGYRCGTVGFHSETGEPATGGRTGDVQLGKPEALFAKPRFAGLFAADDGSRPVPAERWADRWHKGRSG